MSYTRTWNNATPLGTAQADTLETIIQYIKADIEERMQEWFGVANMAETGLQRAFGTRVVKSEGTIYEALTDGFVTAHLKVTGTGTGRLALYVGGSSPPNAILVRCSASTGNGTDSGAFTYPVKKGLYWKVTMSDETGTVVDTVSWVPLG